jgi:type II secretory pathway pseudopilin PulG
MSKAVRPAMAKMAPPTGAGRPQAGIALLAMLIVIAAMSAALGVTGSLWHEVQQREKERELLFIGLQYRNAIKRYYESPGGQNRYPPTLDVLLLDNRTPAIRRHLRKPYRDPLTNSKEWGIVPAPQGGILGVHSLAEGKPIKRANFPAELGWEGGKSRYIDWQFVYVPAVNTAAPPR